MSCQVPAGPAKTLPTKSLWPLRPQGGALSLLPPPHLPSKSLQSPAPHSPQVGMRIPPGMPSPCLLSRLTQRRADTCLPLRVETVSILAPLKHWLRGSPGHLRKPSQSGVLDKATIDAPGTIFPVPPSIVKKGPETSVAKETGDLLGECPGQQVHPDGQSEMVPCHSDMFCHPSMELTQALSLPGYLLGPLSRCWPVGRTEPN